MTEPQFTQKINELIESQNKMIRKRASELWSSGAFDSSEYENDFLLPKAVLYIINLEAAATCKPLARRHNALLKNLICF